MPSKYGTLCCGDAIVKHKLIGSIMLFAATIIWGSAFVSQEIAGRLLQPFTFQSIRCGLAVIGLIPVITISDRFSKKRQGFFAGWLNKRLWVAGILCGIPLFLACNLQQFGLSTDTDAGKSGFLTAMYIIIVPIIGLFRKKKISVMVPISVVIAVVGLYFLSFMGSSAISTGDLLTLCCALMFAIQITFVDIFAPSVDALRLNAIQALVCSVLSGVIAIFTEQTELQNVWACALPIAHTGLLSMGAAYALQILGQKHLEPTVSSLIMSMESVFAVLFQLLILQKWLKPQEIIGCVLVFAAVILSQVEFRKKAN